LKALIVSRISMPTLAINTGRTAYAAFTGGRRFKTPHDHASSIHGSLRLPLALFDSPGITARFVIGDALKFSYQVLTPDDDAIKYVTGAAATLPATGFARIKVADFAILKREDSSFCFRFRHL
jgi:hypothetical protein